MPRIDDRQVLIGVFCVLRSVAPCRDLPERCGFYTTCYNRFNRWHEAGHWDHFMDVIIATYDVDIHMIDCSVVSVRQHAANVSVRRQMI